MLCIQKDATTLLVGTRSRVKRQNKLVEWEVSFDTVGTKSIDFINLVDKSNYLNKSVFVPKKATLGNSAGLRCFSRWRQQWSCLLQL